MTLLRNDLDIERYLTDEQKADLLRRATAKILGDRQKHAARRKPPTPSPATDACPSQRRLLQVAHADGVVAQRAPNRWVAEIARGGANMIRSGPVLAVSHANVRSVVDSFATDPPFAPAELTTLGKQLNLEDWAEEGYALAARYCYLDGTLQLAARRDGYDQDGAVAGPEVPVLPEAVKNAARKVYRQRLVLAGERLANQLNEIFPWPIAIPQG